MKLNYTVIGVCIVLAPIIILAIHLNNKRLEHFAASQGGALQQLMAGHVASEEEVRQLAEYQKKQVVHDILRLTEPERVPGPYPANK